MSVNRKRQNCLLKNLRHSFLLKIVREKCLIKTKLSYKKCETKMFLVFNLIMFVNQKSVFSRCFKMKLGTYTNANMWNLMVMFTFSLKVCLR